MIEEVLQKRRADAARDEWLRDMTEHAGVGVLTFDVKQTGRIGPYTKEYFGADGSHARMLFVGVLTGSANRVAEYCIELTHAGPIE